MVGAVIVCGDRIIGEGYHVRCGEGHAEVRAFASVRPEDEGLLPHSTLYVSLEPCAHYGKTPPCAELIIRKGVRRVVVGCVDTFAKVSGRGIAMLREAGVEVSVGILERDCRALNRVFFTYHGCHRPFITLKWARSADGFLDDHGRAVAFSTPLTRMLVHKLRAERDAILVGRVTDEREHPLLTVRHWVGRNPRRIVLGGGASLSSLLDELYQDGVQSLIVEGGYRTLSSFITIGLWDELRVETAPVAVGGGTPAPKVPDEAILVARNCYDGNVIETFASVTSCG